MILPHDKRESSGSTILNLLRNNTCNTIHASSHAQFVDDYSALCVLVHSASSSSKGILNFVFHICVVISHIS